MEEPVGQATGWADAEKLLANSEQTIDGLTEEIVEIRKVLQRVLDTLESHAGEDGGACRKRAVCCA